MRTPPREDIVTSLSDFVSSKCVGIDLPPDLLAPLDR